MPGESVLYYGDNLEILRRYVGDESIDLIYLDPPFNSNQDYNVLFAERDGTRSAAQLKAFSDTWRWDQAAARSYDEIVEKGGPVSLALQAFRTFLGTNDMLAYLSMMAPRLVELRRVLKASGSIYLHCDPTASHYLKMLMDAVFGPKNFRNEIIWSYRRWPTPAKFFQRMHDVLLLFAKDAKEPGAFNVEYEASSPSYEKRFKGKTQMLDPETKTRKITLEAESKGLPRRDVWELSIIAGFKKERLGYPTQKPEALLERIIRASSREGDVVLDPFCGCGTTIAVAQRLGRHWIGIDITHLAITLIRSRLQDAFNGEVLYRVIGEPTDLEGAKALAEQDRYQFQWWALGKVDARPVAADQKKGADKGIDGRLFFHEREGAPTKCIILQVKSGHVTSKDVRDLAWVLAREKAHLGSLLTLEEPTRDMKEEAATAGFYRPDYRLSEDEKYPKLQILTIEEILKGRKLDYPHIRNVTFKKAPEAQAEDRSSTKASTIHEYDPES